MIFGLSWNNKNQFDGYKYFFQVFKAKYDGNVIVIDGSLIFVTTMDIIDTIRNDIIIL